MDIRNFFAKKRRLAIDNEPNVNEINVSAVTTDATIDNFNVIPCTSSTSITVKTLKTPETLDLHDIALVGEPIKQIYLDTYPKTNNRSFHSDWFKRFKWLQYSVQNDAAFCYPCHQFLPNASKQGTYTDSGFRNWKNALDSKTGFSKHEKSVSHIQAMVMWKEKMNRSINSRSVSTLVNNNILEIHRYYVRSIIEVIQFLTVNELALRGTYVVEEEKERGLFQKLFEYTIKKDPTLKTTLSHIPQNAKYTSPEIQNEIIEIMAETVRENIVSDIQKSDVPWFTLMEDGTRDKNNRENIAIAIRYVKDGVVKESLLIVTTTKKLDAASFTDTTLNILENCKLKKSCLLSQCYDGASVMSGKVGGVSARIEKALQRKIPYVHCYNHRLHLVVVRTVSEIRFISQYFDQCIMLHEFLQHGKIAGLYEGKTVGRLLAQRWTGHLAVTNVIWSDYDKILKTLGEIKSKNFSGDDVAKSIGLQTVMRSLEFRVALTITKKILTLLQPADASLQGRSTGLKDAIDIVKIVKHEITRLRTEEGYKSILNEASSLLPNETIGTSDTRPKRQVKSVQMKDFIILGLQPTSSCRGSNDISPFKAEYYETIDIVAAELDRRFSDNEELLDSIACVDQFDVEKLSALKELGIKIPSKEEFTVVKAFITRNREEHVFDLLYKQREAFKDTYELFAAVATFGCSTAVCESTFSALTAINRPQRMSMSHQRMADLIYLAFEHKKTECIDIEVVLKKFNSKSHRRLQLY